MGLAFELQPYLVQMVLVDVYVTEGENELAGRQSSHLGDHHGEERVGRNVERNSQKQIGTPLVQLAGQSAIGGSETA